MCTYTISISLKPAYLNTFVKFISGRAGDVRLAKRIWKFKRRNVNAVEMPCTVNLLIKQPRYLKALSLFKAFGVGVNVRGVVCLF